MRHSLKFFLFSLVTCVLLSALTACAAQAVPHSFGFNRNKEIEVLDWRYGHSNLPFTHADTKEVATGHIMQGASVGAVFPPGDSLYVKWRVKATGKVYEDAVDLKSRLPIDMTNKHVHFLIKGAQLYIYLIPGKQFGQANCPVESYKYSPCSQIYP